MDYCGLQDDIDGSNRKDILVTKEKKIAGLEKKVSTSLLDNLNCRVRERVLQLKFVSMGFN